MEIITNLRGNIIVIIDFQLKTNSELEVCDVNPCYGVTKDPKEDDYMLVFGYARNGDLHKHLSKNFKEITWWDKIRSLHEISRG